MTMFLCDKFGNHIEPDHGYRCSNDLSNSKDNSKNILFVRDAVRMKICAASDGVCINNMYRNEITFNPSDQITYKSAMMSLTISNIPHNGTYSVFVEICDTYNPNTGTECTEWKNISYSPFIMNVPQINCSEGSRPSMYEKKTEGSTCVCTPGLYEDANSAADDKICIGCPNGTYSSQDPRFPESLTCTPCPWQNTSNSDILHLREITHRQEKKKTCSE